MPLGNRGNRYKTQPPYQTQAMPQTPAPAYGLSGAESALMQGGQAGIEQLTRTGQDVGGILSGAYGAAQDTMSPYTTAGAGASDLQAALSGAMGAGAQQTAMGNYQSSPYVDQARLNAERAILRNASATGGIGGGNTLDQLYQNAAGMFMQDYGNQFNRLGQVADRGYGAAQNIAGIGASLGGQGAGIRSALGQQAAQIPGNVSSQIGGYRYQAGRDLSSNIGQTTSALANLINQQGAGISDMTGEFTTNVNNLIQASAQGDAQAKEQLAMLLSNLAVGQGSQLGSIPAAQLGSTNRLGQTGQLASGIGALLGSMNQGGGQTNQDIYGANTINALRIPDSMLQR